MATQEKATPQPMTPRLAESDFNEIEKPGAYVIKSTGTLVRVQPEGLAPGHSPMISLTSVDQDATRVRRLSENPNTPISKLRRIAADADQYVAF